MILCLFFFFFKQKTTYEMRISDWSSDVCSSDLVTGDLSLAFSNVSFSGAANSAISSYRGSRITLQSVALGLGVRPATGIADFGASVITGENSAIYRGTNCWAGEIFSESAAGVAGENSGVAATVAVTPLPASLTGAKIQAYADAYADARATNSARSVKRPVNSSSWVCTARSEERRVGNEWVRQWRY